MGFSFNPLKAVTRAVGIPDKVVPYILPVPYIAGRIGDSIINAAGSKLSSALGSRSQSSQYAGGGVMPLTIPYAVQPSPYYQSPPYQQIGGSYLGGSQWDSSTSLAPMYPAEIYSRSDSMSSGPVAWEDRLANFIQGYR